MPLFSDPDEDMSARISSFGLSDIFELAGLFHKKGLLRAVGSDGRWGSCHFCPGGLWGVSSGHLEGAEAALTMLHWKDGLFRIFLTPEAAPPCDLLHPNHMVLEHARLHDEFERRAAHFPGTSFPLILRRHAPVLEDPLGCGLPAVEQAASKFPGVTASQLEHLLPLAPIKIHLSVAALAAAGIVSGKQHRRKLPGAAPAPDAGHGEWWRRALARHQGVLRILIAFPLRGCTEGVRRGIEELAQEVGGAAPEVRFSSHTPVFVRIRPRDGGLLSLTFLPEMNHHACLFEAFSHSCNLVLVCGARSREVRGWMNALPSGVTGGIFGESCGGGCSLTETIRELAESHAAIRPAPTSVSARV